MQYTAELIAVGTELLLGNITNTDAQMLSEGLSTLGINVYYHTVVGDNPARLKEALEIARKRANIIITTGGLGPTYDDLTKQTICETFGLPMTFREDLWEALVEQFVSRGTAREAIPEGNKQQVMLPVGCTVLDNPVGTAPGCAFEKEGVHVLMLPGPPFECRYMFEHKARPYLEQLTHERIFSHELRIFGMGEGRVDEILREEMSHLTNPTLAPYAKTGEVLLRATAKAPTTEEAEAMLKPVIADVYRVLGDVVYGVDVDSLEQVVLALLKEKKLTLSFAESCTGGLLAKRITDLPGASAVFKGGIVSYTNEVKAGVLGVPFALLHQYGAVSEPVAIAMAEGCRRVCGSDLALSITGVAGPDSDDRGNPVGTVYAALASADGTVCRKLDIKLTRSRGLVRHLAGHNAFDMIRRKLLDLPL
ncbi:MAG: competence/damage-inducible protein A [Ruminococcaceae bacterium]|nr:competence/damage-inducible protein A [Oscillospiraceae bacterium]